MKRTALYVALMAASIFVAESAVAASFTYHGVLQDAGKPAEGKYDIELTLYSSPTGGTIVGGPLVLYGVPVHEGAFSTDADFGPLAKPFTQAYVGVQVRGESTGSFTPLPGVEAVVDTNTSCPGSWSLDGNAGNPSGSYLGTADSQPLVLKTAGAQIVRTDMLGGGSIPRWLGGGSQNGSSTGSQAGFIGNGGSNTDSSVRNQVGNFSAVVGGQKNSAGYSAANGFSFIGGGNTNTANVDYGTIGGGRSNSVSANYATVGGGQTNSASAVGATVAGGEINLAGGVDSFAAGNGAIVASDHSFVWGDGGALFGDTGPAEFDIRASGGVAINGNPEDNATELTIYPSASHGGNFSNIFFGLNGQAAGILISAGNASTSTSNDASFYFDDYNGATQTRLLSIVPNGIVVGGTSPSESDITLIPPGATTKIVMDAHGSQQADMGFEISKVPTGAGSATAFMNFGAAGELQIFNATATKPGGGSWTAPSDRRIKQEIVPIRDAVDTIMKLRPVNFHYTPEYRASEGGLADKEYAGFIAQEFQEVFPEAITHTNKRVPGAGADEPTILALDSNPALITAVAAVQELATENADLHHQVDELAARLSKLEARKGN
jgi:hypothetical protein